MNNTDTFMLVISHLSFKDIISISEVCKKFNRYCKNSNNHWELLTNKMYSNNYNYYKKLNYLHEKYRNLNYLVYIHIINLLDPISQLTLYYKYDITMFYNEKYNNIQRFLALFILGIKSHVIYDRAYFRPFNSKIYINFLNNVPISICDINNILNDMAMNGNINGILLMINHGGDIHNTNEKPLRLACDHGHLEVVKYLIDNGANIITEDDSALRYACLSGNLNIVEYLINIHTTQKIQYIFEPYDFGVICGDGYLDIIKLLLINNKQEVITEQHINQGIIEAARYGQLGIAEYLIREGAEVNEALVMAADNGQLEMVKFLINNGANKKYKALEVSSLMGNKEVVKFLLSKGADTLLLHEKARKFAIQCLNEIDNESQSKLQSRRKQKNKRKRNIN